MEITVFDQLTYSPAQQVIQTEDCHPFIVIENRFYSKQLYNSLILISQQFIDEITHRGIQFFIIISRTSWESWKFQGTLVVQFCFVQEEKGVNDISSLQLLLSFSFPK